MRMFADEETGVVLLLEGGDCGLVLWGECEWGYLKSA